MSSGSSPPTDGRCQRIPTRYGSEATLADGTGIRWSSKPSASNDRTNFDTVGHPHSDALHTFECFTRVDDRHISYEITLDDPKAFTKPWKNMRIFTLRPDWEVMEYSCEENDKDFTEGHIK
jgi:hypothetical protein